MDERVHHAFEAFDEAVRDRLLDLRELIYRIAETTDGVGRLEETLKWGEISYLNPAGTTLRIGTVKDGNVDNVFEKALGEGATEVYPVADQFYRDRSGRLRDPFGHHWIIATQIREVSDEEMVGAYEATFDDAQ